jgi:hypothetical protein
MHAVQCPVALAPSSATTRRRRAGGFRNPTGDRRFPSDRSGNEGHPSEGIIVSEQEKDSGGPHYGGERGGKSAGNDGGQGGQGEAEGDVGAEQRDEQGNQPGDVGGRGPTERSRRG